jgi:hypothetical protein
LPSEPAEINRMHACTVREEPLERTRPFHIMEETSKALYSTVSVGASQEAEQEALYNQGGPGLEKTQ